MANRNAAKKASKKTRALKKKQMKTVKGGTMKTPLTPPAITDGSWGR